MACPNGELRTILIATLETHTMADCLRQYIAQKIHPDLLNTDKYTQILVAGEIRRKPPARIAAFECQTRLLDFQRPTTTVKNDGTIQLNCFPSRSFVLHYASLVASYLSLSGMDHSIVRAIIPAEAETAKVILDSNISGIGAADLAVIGEVANLKRFTTGTWHGGGDSERDIFKWQMFVTPKGKKVVFLGCLEHIWGEAGYHLVRILEQQTSIKCAIYIAKAGSLRSNYFANEWIATGEDGFLEGKPISWRSPFDEDMLKKSPNAASGPIVTVPSPLCETKKWLQTWSSAATWVDCEIGHMARASNEARIQFGFLDIVSDNLHRTTGENLSNEESQQILLKRQTLFREIERILEALFARWDCLDDYHKQKAPLET